MLHTDLGSFTLGGMLIKDQAKHFIETMKSIYVGACVGLVTAMVVIEFIKACIRQFSI